MRSILLSPPIAFTVIMLFSVVMSLLTGRLSAHTPSHPAGRIKPYACGEDYPSPRMQPDYAQFFHFAFFFTVMHVLALMIATVPFSEALRSGNPYLYVLAALCALTILFRKEDDPS